MVGCRPLVAVSPTIGPTHIPDSRFRSDFVDYSVMTENPAHLSTTPTLQILEAAESGDIQLIATLLGRDPDLANASGAYAKTPLHWAAENDHADAARLLLDGGADLARVTTWGATPLEWAGYLGSRAVAELLIERGAKGMNLVLAAGLR